MGHSLVDHILGAALEGTLFFCAVWAFCHAFRRVPAVWRCWLWRLVSVKFVLALGVAISVPILVSKPPSPQKRIARTALQKASPQKAAPSQPALTPIHQEVLPPLTATVSRPNAEVDFMLLLTGIWFAGFVYVLSRDIRAWLRAKDILESAEEEALFELESHAHDTLINCGQRAPVRIRFFEDLAAPAVMGLFQPTIVLPVDYETTSPGALRSALAHELAHLRRRDVPWVILGEGVKAIFWFNPLAWLACREQRVEAEIAADQLARKWTKTSPKEYAQHLLEWIDPTRDTRLAVKPVPGLLLSTHELARRMNAMTTRRYPIRAIYSFGAVLSIPLFLALAPLRIVTIEKMSGLASSGWPKFHGDSENTGRSPGFGAKGVQKWTYAMREDTESSPAIGGNGLIYVGSGDHSLYALDENTGKLRWSYLTGANITSSPAVGSDGTVIFGSQNCYLLALDGKTGQEKWSFLADNFIYAGPAIANDGTVYVGSWDSKIYALDGTNGNVNWTYKTNDHITSDPAIAPDGTVYVGSQDKSLYALNGKTGQKIWSFQTEGAVNSASIGADGTVYAGSWDGRLYAIDGKTGAQKWAMQTGGQIDGCPAIATDGVIYIGSADHRLYAVDPATGKRKWAFVTQGPIFASPSIAADGTVYVASQDASLYALNPQTGSKIWSFKTSASIDCSPAIGPNGVIYLGNTEGALYAIK